MSVRTLIAAACACVLLRPAPAHAEPLAQDSRNVCDQVGAAGCIYVPAEREDHTEATYRAAAGEPDWRRGGVLGVALSGGGSKAAPFAMGVLAGLHDERLLLPRGPAGGKDRPQDVAIASVSGGGYAAYHLFSQLARGASTPAAYQETLDNAYADCTSVPRRASDGLLSAMMKFKVGCGPRSSGDDWHKRAEQAKVKCAQDILQPGECNFARIGHDAWSTAANIGLMAVPTLLSLPTHHFFNTLFDHGVSMSPSQVIYRSGIGVTYGSLALPDSDRSPANARELLNCPDDSGNYDRSAPSRFSDTKDRRKAPRVRHCRTVLVQRDAPTDALSEARASVHIAPEPLKFQQLRELRPDAQAPAAPFWIIQAAAPRHRSVYGWARGEDPNIAYDTFEFTPHGFGSLRYGFLSEMPRLDVLDATVSAAAFFDENQQVKGRGLMRTALGLLQHGANVSWGTDIPNYNVSDGRRVAHRALPFPLYFLDSQISTMGAGPQETDRRRSVFIRVIDGGNADDSGIYALLRRGIRTIVFSDAAQDTRGNFDDLCALRAELLRADDPRVRSKPLYLNIPGLQDFARECTERKRSWDVFSEWKHDLPVLLGCVSEEESGCADASRIVSRLIVVKPRLEWNLQDGSSGFERAVRWQATRPPAVHQCVHGLHLFPDGVPCSATQDSGQAAACLTALPCEAVSLLLTDDQPPPTLRSGFPQTSTVLTTINSSAGLFASSRELARHYTRLASAVIRDALDDGRSGLFARTIAQQHDKAVAPR